MAFSIFIMFATTIQFQIFSSLQMKTLYPLSSYSFPSPQSLTITYLLLSLQIFLFKTLHINEIGQGMTFYVWLISLSIYLKIHLYGNVSLLQSFYGCLYITICLSFYLLVDILFPSFDCCE